MKKWNVKTYALMVKDFLDAVHSPAYLLFVLSLIPFELINGVVVVGILQLLILVNLLVCVYNFVHQLEFSLVLVPVRTVHYCVFILALYHLNVLLSLLLLFYKFPVFLLSHGLHLLVGQPIQLLI